MNEVWLSGWHVLQRLLEKRKRKIFKIYVTESRVNELMQLTNLPFKVVSPKMIEEKVGTNSQGVAFLTTQINFWNLSDWEKTQGEKSFLLAIDQVQDSHNLGAIIRTARAFKCNGILLTKLKCAPFNATLNKSAAGALEDMDVVMVSNLVTSLKNLQLKNYKVYAMDHEGKTEWSKSEKMVLVLGQEGKGLRALTKKTCDYIIKVNTCEEFPVLNVSVAAGIGIHSFLGKN